MKTTKFGKVIIDNAENVLAMGYRAGEHNYYGEVLEAVVKEFDKNSTDNKKYYAGKGKKQPDYCAITQSVILDRAFKDYNQSTNKFHNAGAKSILQLCKDNGIRIDNKPQIGSLFFTKRNGGSGYHVGLVWDIIGNNIKTIEGNTWSSSAFIVKKDGCKIKLDNGEYGILSRMRGIETIDSFGHMEEYFDKEIIDYPSTISMLADTRSVFYSLSDENAQCSMENYEIGAEGGEPYEEEPKAQTLLFGIPKNYIIIGGVGITLALIIYLGRR